MASLETALSALLAEKKYATARDILITMNGADIESVFEELPEESLPLLFRLLPKELAAEVFVEMDPEEQEMLIRGFSDSELKEVVDELYADDAADLVEEMPANVVKRILKTADPDLRKTINELLKYPEDSAGSIMTTEMVTLRPAMTVAEAPTARASPSAMWSCARSSAWTGASSTGNTPGRSTAGISSVSKAASATRT